MKLTSLGTKVALPCFAFGCLFVWLLLYEVPKRQNATINMHAQTELQTISELLAISVKSALDRDDFFLLQDIQQSLLVDNQSSFAAVFLETEDGSELIASYPPGLNQDAIETFVSLDDAVTSSSTFASGNQQGRVIAGLNADAARARSAARIAPLYLAAGLLLAFSLILLVMLRQRVILPLQEAAMHAAQLRSGDYNLVRRYSAHNDEVGMLQESLDDLGNVLFAKEKSQQALMLELQLKVSALEMATAAERRSYEMKQRFVANVSHEVRTPLNAILGLSTLLQSDNLSAAQSDRVRRITRSGEHLLSIINDILNFSKLESGKLSVQRESINTKELLANVINIAQPLAAAKSLEFIVDLHQDFPETFEGDGQRISQVVLNLLNNAIKFTKHGHVLLELRPIMDHVNQQVLSFSVTDTGPGISEVDLKKLFREFHQLDNSATREAGGTGLGLTISKKLAELMHGNIEVASEPGSGSRFAMLLPIKNKAPTKARRTVSKELNSSAKVLIVDDNPVTLKIMVNKLTSGFGRVSSARSGALALEKIESAMAANDPYDVVLMDWLMPGLDGIATAEVIRQKCESTKIEIICMTGSPDNLRSVLPKGETVPFDMLLSKPLHGGDVIAVVEQITRGKTVSPDSSHEQAVVQTDEQYVFTQFENARALLVEDNEINQEVAEGFLKKFGFEVDVVGNGEEALRRLLSYPPCHYDLCFMDLQMPVMDGFTATREIRKYTDLASLPIIAMTASAYESDRQLCIDVGMDDFVPKPINIDRLHQTICRWMIRAGKCPYVVAAPFDSPAVQRLTMPKKLPEIDGLDTASALVLNGQDEELLIRSLRRFAEQWPFYSELLNAGHTKGNREELIRLTHTLTGTCGGIGATKAAELAKSAHRLLLAPELSDDQISLLDYMLNGLITELSALVDCINSSIGE